MEWFTCRVQFVNDTDPLTYSNTSFPEPPRPPFHCFNANIPLVNQLPAVHRLLGAPHQVIFSLSFLGLKNKTKQKTNLYVFIFLSMVV
jgi:hypothetical protein